MNQMTEYLRPTPAIDCDSASIKRKADDLTRGQHEVTDKAKSLFYFVRDEIKYRPHIVSDLLEDYRASKILRTGEGWCVQKAVLLAALARAAGIPARLHLADIRNYLVSDRLKELMGTNLFVYHGYDELYIEGKWVKATPAFDLKMCQDNRIVPVEFDGKSDAIFHSHNVDGELHIEYVEDHGCYQDLPLDEILAAFAQVYGLGSGEELKHAVRPEKAQKQGTGT